MAMRPFSFTASVTSVIFGGIAAVAVGGARLDLAMLVLAAVAMALLHGGANAINDAADYRKGLDGPVLPVSGAVVRGFLTPSGAARLGVCLMALGSLLGLVIARKVGWPIVGIGVLGTAVGVLYSATPRVGLKYHALGDLSVFVDFGILGTLGGWVTQTHALSMVPVLWGVPLSLHVVGILHANNWRDIRSDTANGVSTVASRLGDLGSLRYYTFLVTAPFVLVLAYIVGPRLVEAVPAMPLGCALAMLALPLAVRNLGRARRRTTPAQPFDFLALDGATAQLNMMFGLLCTLGMLSALLGRHA